MAKSIIKKLVIVILLVLIPMVAVKATTLKEIKDSIYNVKPSIFGNEIYNSNRYTQVDDLSIRDDSKNIEISSTGVETIFYNEIYKDDKLISKNDKLEMYFDSKTQIFKIKNIETGYIWSSAFYETSPDNSEAVNARLTSIALIEFYSYNEETKKLSNNLTEHNTNYYTNKIGVGRKYMASVESYPDNANAKVTLFIDFLIAKIRFAMDVTLKEDGLHVYIPNNQIEEYGNSKLASITVFPTFGATCEDLVPGYFILPDGTGALYRFKDNGDELQPMYNAKYYGGNIGLKNGQTNNFSQYTLPFYGNVHGINQDGYFCHIIEGDKNANLIFNPSGASNISYNYITNKFIFRESYIYPTSLSESESGGGINVIEDKKSTDNIHFVYQFVGGNDASYVGIANKYREYLINNNILEEKETNYGMSFEFLLSESESGLFGNRTFAVTKVKEVKEIIQDYITSGGKINNIVLKGWAKGGLSGMTPYKIRYESKVGTKNDFNELEEYCTENNIQVIYYNDYLKTYSSSKRSNESSDFARGYHKLKLKTTIDSYMYKDEYYLYPFKSLEFAKEDAKEYSKLSIDSLALDSIGYMLFSYNDDNVLNSRSKTASLFNETLIVLNEKNIKTSVYQPNYYLLNQTDNYLDYPIYNLQITIFDDTIPFLSIVLHDTMDLYSPLTNLSTNQEELALLYLDFGINPSYILTNDSTYKLKFTNSWNLYSTIYKNWKDNILRMNQKVKGGFEEISGAHITSRLVRQKGVVESDYSNGVKIIFNYTTEAINYNGTLINPVDYLLIGGDK